MKHSIYREIMLLEFEKRKRGNPKYSQAAFSRDLKITPSFLHNIITGKKSISKHKARMIASQLKLPLIDQEIFVTSAAAESEKKLDERKKQKQILRQLLSDQEKSKKLNELEFSKIHTWLHFAILSLFEIKHANVSAESVSSYFGVSRNDALICLKNLEDLGYIKKDGNTYIQAVHQTESPFDIPLESIKNFHRASLQKSAQKLSLPVHAREFISLICALNSDDIPEAKQFVRSFLWEFQQKFCQTNHQNKVYQLSLQLVPLDNPQFYGEPNDHV